MTMSSLRVDLESVQVSKYLRDDLASFFISGGDQCKLLLKGRNQGTILGHQVEICQGQCCQFGYFLLTCC